jgi:SnoaL-like domain
MRPSRLASVLLGLVLAAPAARAQRRPPSPPISPPVRESAPLAPPVSQFDADAGAAMAAVTTFIAAEAQNGAPADTLLDGSADFIMTGVRVTTRPRLAGLNGPGTATIEESSSGMAGAFAWVVVRYRFDGRTSDLNELAHATFILEKQRAGWRIRHVHSSMVERW